jgi:hypothetical protein
VGRGITGFDCGHVEDKPSSRLPGPASRKSAENRPLQHGTDRHSSASVGLEKMFGARMFVIINAVFGVVWDQLGA